MVTKIQKFYMLLFFITVNVFINFINDNLIPSEILWKIFYINKISSHYERA